MAGVLGAIETNSAEILAAARASFCPAESTLEPPQLHFRFWADPAGTTKAPWPKPTFRGLDHLVYLGLDTQSSIMIDLKNRRAMGRLSPALAADQRRWISTIFPNLLSFIGPSVGLTELHCACVARNGKGMLLAGRSGSGKSTLTMALATQGFDFLADDWTYFSRSQQSVTAWGLIPRLKLLPSAAAYFPELGQCATVTSENGEQAFEIDPFRNLGITSKRSCEAGTLIFLERSSVPEFALTRMPPAEAAAQLEENLLTDSPEALEPQLETIRRLVKCGAWRLRFGEDPHTVARKLAAHFIELNPQGMA